jgi:hypothetical protein
LQKPIALEGAQMYKKLLFASLLIALIFVLLPQVFAGGSPHIVLGTVRTSTGDIPKADKLTITAYITVRPDDIMTYPPNDFTKIAYDEPTAQWMIQVAGFAGAWTTSETLRIDFQDCGNGEAGFKEVILNFEPSQNVGQVPLTPVPLVEIVSYEPPDGSILDIAPQTVTITFSDAMDPESVLQNSRFIRKNVTDNVTEIEANICTFLQWFGFTDPASVAKYKGYGCSEPFGGVTPNMVDVTFSGEGGSSVLEITLKDLTVGQPKKPIGPKEYLISITVNEAKGLCGNPLDDKGHVNYTYYMTQVESVDAAVGGTFTLLDGVVEVTIPPGAFDKDTQLMARPVYPSDTIPSFLSDVMKIIPGYGKEFVLELDPPPSTPFAQPVTISVKYNDGDIPIHPGEKALRLYRVKDGRWQPILGFPPDTVANTLDADVTEFSTFALLNGAPYGDINGTNGDSLIDIADVTILLKQIVGKAQIFGGVDVEFAKYAADVSLAVAGGEPEIPDIGDVVLILKRIVGKIDKFPVEEVVAGPSLIALYPPASGHSTLFMKRSSFGNGGTISIILDNASDILSAEIGLIYDAKVLKFTGVLQTSLASHQVMEYNAVNAGELQIALVSVQPLSSGSPVLNIQFEMAEGASKFELDSVKLTKVKLNNGLVKAKLEAFPQKLTLLQNYPNPFNPETWIPYRLAQSSDVEIRIYNVSGQLVRTIHVGKQSPGNYVTREKAAYWDGLNNKGEKVTSGVYFYQLLAGKNNLVRKMVILK